MSKQPAKTPLSAKKELFCHEYIKDLNASESGKRAGYAATTAVKRCPCWVTPKREKSTCVEVWDRVQELKDARAKECGIDAKWVLDELVKCYKFTLSDFLVTPKEGGLPYYDLSNATPEQLSLIESLQIDTYFEGRGPDAEEVKKIAIKAPGKLKALALIGKHINVNAFEEHIKHSGEIGITIDDQDSKL